MRIEKISDKQIRCTLNQKDLKDREIGISELAYGTAKAKALFRDMMEQASYELGFNADDIPLMIEAIPLLPEALVLVITKVDEPDELDTRFSCFTEEKTWDNEDGEFFYDEDDVFDDDELIVLDDDLIILDNGQTPADDESSDIVRFSSEESVPDRQDDFISLPEALGMEPRPREQEKAESDDIVMIFSFPTLSVVTQLAHHIHTMYHGENTLYKNSSDNTYYLVLHRRGEDTEVFRKVCNILHEYGTPLKNSAAGQYYYEEHFKPIITGNALDILAGF